MRACMTYSTSTTSIMGGVAMSTSACRPTGSSAECTTTSSEFAFSISHTHSFHSHLYHHHSPPLILSTHSLPASFPPSLLPLSLLLATRLIVIAEKKTVYEKFPTPLINRLEKHFVLTSSVLTEEELDVLHLFQEWLQQVSSVTRTSE